MWPGGRRRDWCAGTAWNEEASMSHALNEGTSIEMFNDNESK